MEKMIFGKKKKRFGGLLKRRENKELAPTTPLPIHYASRIPVLAPPGLKPLPAIRVANTNIPEYPFPDGLELFNKDGTFTTPFPPMEDELGSHSDIPTEEQEPITFNEDTSLDDKLDTEDFESALARKYHHSPEIKPSIIASPDINLAPEFYQHGDPAGGFTSPENDVCMETLAPTVYRPLNPETPSFIPHALPLLDTRAVLDHSIPKTTSTGGFEGVPKGPRAMMEELNEETVDPREFLLRQAERQDSYDFPIKAGHSRKRYYSGGSASSLYLPSPRKNVANLNKIPSMEPDMSCGTPLPLRRPLVQLQRRDAARKDLIIEEDLITCNLHKHITNFFPNGTSWQQQEAYFDATENEDIIQLLNTLPREQKRAFFAKRKVEVIVKMKSLEQERRLVERELALRAEASLNLSEPAQKRLFEEEAAIAPKIVNTMMLLGPDLVEMVTKLHVTLDFPASIGHIPFLAIEGPEGKAVEQYLMENDQIAPGTASHGVPRDLSYLMDYNVQLTGKVVKFLHNFTNIKELSVCLATPSNTRNPLSIPQLNCLLPFYELEFTKWSCWWATKYMMYPELITGWPLQYCDRERMKIVHEKEHRDKARTGKAGYVRLDAPASSTAAFNSNFKRHHRRRGPFDNDLQKLGFI